MTTEELRLLIEVETTVELWGQKTRITPRLCGKVFGDGGQLVALSPIVHRPMYYVVRIDSLWHLDCNAGEPCDEKTCLREFLYGILDALEEQFEELVEYEDMDGNPLESLEGLEDNEWEKYYPFSEGAEWFGMEWPKAA